MHIPCTCFLHSLTVDPALDSLLPLAAHRTYRAKDGSNGNPAQGTGGSRKRGKVIPRTPPLRVGVPPGTVVRKKRGGVVLGELINVGDTLCVARGGRGTVTMPWGCITRAALEDWINATTRGCS